MVCNLAISGGDLKGFSPQVGSLRILETTRSTLSLEAKINITNPTEYSAIVPYVNIKMLSNGTEIGHATARHVSVVPGPNHNILVEALWDPLTPSGQKGLAQGKELLSQYISGQQPQLDRCFAPTLHPITKSSRLQYIPHPRHPRRHDPSPTQPRQGPLLPLHRHPNPQAHTAQKPKPRPRR